MSDSQGTLVAPRKKSGRVTRVVKIEGGLVRKGEIIASDRGESLSEYLSELIRGPLERDWLKILKKLAAEEQKKGGGE